VTSVCISTSTSLARELFRTVAKLKPALDKDLYDPHLQRSIREAIRAQTTDGFDWLVEEIRLRLVEPPYFAYVSGLQFDKANLLLVGLTGAFGDVVDPYNQAWSRLVRYIRPSTDRAVPSLGVLNENLHTDGTDWCCPNDLTCLLCVRQDQNGGGRSQMMDLPSVKLEVETQIGRHAVDVMCDKSTPWRIADELGGGIFRAPVLGAEEIRWLHYTIRSAVDCGLAQLSEDTAQMLQAVNEALAKTSNAIHFLAEPGSLVLINNKRCLHARTAISTPRLSERLVLRTKVQRPNSVPPAQRPPAWHY